jgi:hypothetical protein
VKDENCESVRNSVFEKNLESYSLLTALSTIFSIGEIRNSVFEKKFGIEKLGCKDSLIQQFFILC